MKELKDKIYEFEGLVELADMRKDKMDTLRPLISRKLEEVNRLWVAVCGETPAPAVPVSEVAETTAVYETEEEPEQMPEADNASEAEAEPVQESEPEPVRETAPKHETVREPVDKKPSIALCLNDRYRFTRVLADGDRKKFDGQMADIAAMPDFDSAREYIIDDCNADPDDSDVMDLLEIVQKYFE